MTIIQTKQQRGENTTKTSKPPYQKHRKHSEIFGNLTVSINRQIIPDIYNTFTGNKQIYQTHESSCTVCTLTIKINVYYGDVIMITFVILTQLSECTKGRLESRVVMSVRVHTV